MTAMIEFHSDDESEVYVSPKYNNGDFDYWLVAEVRLVGWNGIETIASISAVAPEFASDDEIRSAFGCEVDIPALRAEGVNLAVELQRYGFCATLWDSNAPHGGKAVLMEEVAKQMKIIPVLFGFYMDKPVNSVRATGWDFIRGIHWPEKRQINK